MLQVRDLEMYKFVLGHKADEMTEQIEPTKRELRRLQDEMSMQDGELETRAVTNQKLKHTIHERDANIASLKNELFQVCVHPVSCCDATGYATLTIGCVSNWLCAFATRPQLMLSLSMAAQLWPPCVCCARAYRFCLSGCRLVCLWVRVDRNEPTLVCLLQARSKLLSTERPDGHLCG